MILQPTCFEQKVGKQQMGSFVCCAVEEVGSFEPWYGGCCGKDCVNSTLQYWRCWKQEIPCFELEGLPGVRQRDCKFSDRKMPVEWTGMPVEEKRKAQWGAQVRSC